MRREQAQRKHTLDRAAEARIAEMERPDYPFPRRFSRGDYLLWGAVTAVSLLLVIWGVGL